MLYIFSPKPISLMSSVCALSLTRKLNFLCIQKAGKNYAFVYVYIFR